MTKPAQNLLLILLGAAVLWITIATDQYLNYVRPWFWLMLVPAGVAMIVLGLAGLRREWRDGALGAHSGLGVAWLLCLPAAAIFLIAPPALGSFTVARDTAQVGQPLPPPTGGYRPLPAGGGPTPMTLSEFINRAAAARSGDPAALRNRPVALVGFVAPRRSGGWYLARLRLNCCAADAAPLRVAVLGRPRPPEGAWVQVVGTWSPPGQRSGIYELRAQSTQRIETPKLAYEP
jgi:uncharacterized repeat protein (TIGR03943 family)